MQKFEEDFVNEEIIEFEIDGRPFKYKPTTANDENNWVADYMSLVDGKMQQDMTKINKCKIQNLISIPYSQDTVKRIIGLDRAWKNLNKEDKWKLLGKLKPSVFSQIIIKINEIDAGSVVKKN